ncbi:cytidine deaminase-like protein [Chytriomyces sp. MP71]|nr:cytidine deaminase-like protein [Chytriomyces sp. MP71]
MSSQRIDLPADLVAQIKESQGAVQLPASIQTQLCALAMSAKTHSYSPYSKFPVGAAALAEDGTVYLGCNVENASYGGAICAERTAFVKAVSEGQRSFVAVAVVTNLRSFASPCGFCRQFMVEFGKNLQVIIFSYRACIRSIVPLFCRFTCASKMEASNSTPSRT